MNRPTMKTKEYGFVFIFLVIYENKYLSFFFSLFIVNSQKKIKLNYLKINCPIIISLS